MIPEHAVDRWRTLSRSGTNNCVEVGRVAEGAAVRDTKDRSAGCFTATAGQWAAFVGALKDGRYDG